MRQLNREERKDYAPVFSITKGPKVETKICDGKY
jgi:hypothetical protein